MHRRNINDYNAYGLSRRDTSPISFGRTHTPFMNHRLRFARMANVIRFPDSKPAQPRNAHRVTFFIAVGPTNRPLTCAAYDVVIGLELRLFYARNDVMRSALFRGVDGEERLVEEAMLWRAALLEKGFSITEGLDD